MQLSKDRFLIQRVYLLVDLHVYLTIMGGYYRYLNLFFDHSYDQNSFLS